MTATSCEYKFRNGDTCGEDVCKVSPYRIRRIYIECGEERYREEVYDPPCYCILHLELPTGTDTQYNNIKSEKEAKVREKVKKGDFNFEGAKITSIYLSKYLSEGQNIFDLNFADATIDGYTPYDIAATTIDGCALFNETTIKGCAHFEGITIKGYVSFDGATIEGDARFDGATFQGNAIFKEGVASFQRVTIEGSAYFNDATIKTEAHFDNAAMIKGYAWFNGATFKGNAFFNDATIKEDAQFNGATFKGNASFERVTIDGDIEFLEVEISYKDGRKIIKPATLMKGANFKKAVIKGDALFDKAIIDGVLACHSTEIVGKLSFEHAKIKHVEAQEEAYRKAKQVWEKLGDRKRADDYFYKEMVAKREQKAQPIKFLEQLIIQYALGYGVYPLRMMFAWIVIALAMGAFLTSVTGDINDLPFGISAAFIPGYGLSGYGISLSHIFSGLSLWIIRIETLVSEFFVAAFIVVFSRKFMR